MEIREEISRVAQEIYLHNGKLDGHDLDNWLEAEKLVLSWHMPDEVRENHIGACEICEQHVIEPTKDEVTS